jgi:hypothetical protein
MTTRRRRPEAQFSAPSSSISHGARGPACLPSTFRLADLGVQSRRPSSSRIEQLEQLQLLRPNNSNQIARAFQKLRHDVVARRAARNSPHILKDSSLRDGKGE